MATKTTKLLIDNLFLVLIYYLTAHLSLLFLSISPANAVSIWPPTGISLAAVLLRGYGVLPAIFIADLIIAIEIEGFNDFTSIVFSLAVGFQAMITAWIGTKLIHRFIGESNLLIDNKSILLFFFLGGPVSLLLPTVLIFDVQYWLGMVEGSELLLSFFTWWLGGTIGSILFAPITLILFGDKSQQSRILTVVIPLTIIFVLLVWLFAFTRKYEQQRVKSNFNWKYQALHAVTLNELDTLQHKAQELSALVRTTDKLDKKKFNNLSHHILANSPYITALAWLARETDETKNDYFAVKFVASKSNYQAMIGLDFSISKTWNKVLETAKRTRKTDLILPIRIYQKGEIKELAALVLAVFDNKASKSTTKKSTPLLGYTVLLLPLHGVMNNAISQAADQQIFLNITGHGFKKTTFFKQLENHSGFMAEETLYRFGQKLKFTYHPGEAFVDDLESLPIGWIFIFGLGITTLVSFTLLSITGQTAQTQKLVEKKTKDLFSKQQLLQTVLDNVQEAILAIDERGNLTVFNKAARKICGRDINGSIPEKWLESFKIQNLQGVTLLEKEDKPLLKLLSYRRVRDFEFTLIQKNKTKIILQLNSSQVMNEENQVVGSVASFQNITDQKQAHDELKKLSWAVEYSPASILITNSEGKIDYVNSKFVEMTGYEFHEVNGKSPTFLSSNQTDKQIYRDLWETIIAGKEWRGELLNKKKNGVFYWSKQLIAPIIDEQQKIIHFIAIQEDITEEKKAADILSHQASHDQLTGLLNRRECEKRLDRVIQSSHSHQSTHVFCFLDLDKFKNVNDSCGHYAGDCLLQEVSKLFKQQLRQRDTLVRLGGDEFGVIMEHCTLEQARTLANQICQSIADYKFTWEDQEFKIGVSIGLTSIDNNTTSYAHIVSQADDACYAAKKSGRGQVCIK